MLIEREDGTFDAGPLDLLCILKLPTGTHHAAFFEEKPMPGPVVGASETDIVRLKSKMHHTGGSPTLEGAQRQLDTLREKILVPDISVLREVAVEVDDPVNVWVLRNWTIHDRTLEGEARNAGLLPPERREP